MANLKTEDMSRQRDEKGRFVKGSPKEKGRDFTSETGRLAGIASGEAKRRNKLLKEELRDILMEETTKGSGVTKMQAVIQNVLKNTLSKGKALDLKIIAEILGEMEINVNLNQAEKPKIVFDDGEDE